jgi:nucleotide-binding universal stress UspA family protein
MNTEAQVVVGYDGTPGSLAALGWAVRIASLRDEGVVATTIEDPRENPRGGAWPQWWWDEVELTARELVAQWPDVTLTVERHVGPVVPMLVESARAGSMLVVGSHGHGLAGEVLLGSVSQGAARHAGVPVVVVRPAQNPESGRIVVGVDGSEASNHAVRFACETARVTGDKVIVMRSWHPTAVAVDHYGYQPPLRDETMAHAEAALGRTVDQARTDHPHVDIEAELTSAAAGRELVDASANASMLVVGSRGLGAVAGVLMGSVSQHVLHKAHCPVAVIH